MVVGFAAVSSAYLEPLYVVALGRVLLHFLAPVGRAPHSGLVPPPLGVLAGMGVMTVVLLRQNRTVVWLALSTHPRPLVVLLQPH